MKKTENTRVIWFKSQLQNKSERHATLRMKIYSSWEAAPIGENHRKLKMRSIHLIRTDTNALFYSWVILHCVYEHNFHSSANGYLGCFHEPRASCTEWSKSERERQIPYINAYIWNLEGWYWWSYMQGSKVAADIKNRLLDSVGGEGGMIWDNSIETYILPYGK